VQRLARELVEQPLHGEELDACVCLPRLEAANRVEQLLDAGGVQGLGFGVHRIGRC